MTDAASRILTTVDYERNGKQSGALHVPISTNTSAYGTVLLPVTVVKGGRGPTILITAGVHGDEYEGPIVASRLARELRAEAVQGRVIILPALNLPALLQGQRLSPLDGLNLNRVFPGDPRGSITPMIAHYVHSVLLPLADVVVDLHSGGYSLRYVPTVMTHQLADGELMSRTLAAVRAFGAPIGLISRDLDTTGLLENTAERLGKLTLSTELGGGAAVSPDALKIGETGVWNLLRHFGVVEGEVVTPEAQGRAATRLMEVEDLDCYLMAPDDGIFEPFVRLGDRVDAGRPIGQVHAFQHPDRDPAPVVSPRSGEIICERPPARVSKGDFVALVARAYPG